jgi:chemotaxis protein histidine kinase CheA
MLSRKFKSILVVEDAREFGAAQCEEEKAQAEISSLTESFLVRAREDAVHIREIVEIASHGNRSALREVERVAHSLHGAGAMFGFPALSTTGGAIELLVEGIIASNAPSGSTDELTMLNQLLNCTLKLASEVEVAGHTRTSGGMFQGIGLHT